MVQYQTIMNTSTNAFFAQVNVITFTSSGLYYPTEDVRQAIIECWGGGGGGGSVTSTANYAGAGAGAGGYSLTLVVGSALGLVQTITIGAGGAGATAGNDDAENGGTTSVGSLCIANGGGAGSYSTSSAIGAFGSGATAGTGNEIALTGMNGNYGTGGSTSIGQGGIWIQGYNSEGNNASGLGAGGGGAAIPTNSTATAGGNGTAGFVKITEFIAAI